MTPFRSISLSHADTNEIQGVAKTITAANFNRYQQFAAVDPSSWRLVKCKDQMRIYAERRYKRRHTTPQRYLTGDSELQLMLCIGSTPGTLKAVMSGIANPTFNPTETKTSSLNDINGGATLSTIQQPNLKDPFNSLSIKWMELDVRRRSMGFIKNRDYVYVEASGVKDLPEGGRVGYHSMHSIDIPQAHALSGRIRGKLSVCFFFREEKNDTVSVYAMWMMNPMNEQTRRVIVPHFAQMLLSRFKLTQEGKMKKLKESLGKSYSELNSFKLPVATPYFTCVTCSKRVWKFGKFSSQQSTCKLCVGLVCSSCKIDKKPNFLTSNLNATRKEFTLCLSCLNEVVTAEESNLSSTKKPRSASGLLRRMCHSVRSLRSPGWATSSTLSVSFSSST